MFLSSQYSSLKGEASKLLTFMVSSEKAQRDLDIGTKYNREKPVALYNTLLSLHGHPNCRILDLHSGAGKISDIP